MHKQRIKQRLRFRYAVAILLLVYQLSVDFLRPSLEVIYLRVVSGWHTVFHFETYDGPFVLLALLIFHRAVIHTVILFLFTGSLPFTKLYGFIEGFLFVGMIVLYGTRVVFDEWKFLTFDFFHTFLDLLSSPLLLVIFAPAYFLLKT